MNEFKGTPGPYEVSDHLWIEEMEEEVLPISGAQKEVAYVLFRRGEYKVTGEANAHLLAASWEMFDSIDPETLEAIADEIGSEFHNSARADSLRIIARKQRGAIAKALGNE